MSTYNSSSKNKSFVLLSLLAESGKKIFTLDDALKFAHSLGMAEKNLVLILSRLKKEGWVIGLRRGLYALGKGFGLEPIHEFEIATALVSPAIISHWSAFHFHGLTDQIPRIVFVTTSQKTSIPRYSKKYKYGMIKILNVQYRFLKTNEKNLFGIETRWIGSTRVQITDPEKTLIDGLAHPQFSGGFNEVYHAFLLRGKDLNISKIIGYALRMEKSICKRLGWVLKRMGISDRKLEPLKKITVHGFQKLDPTGPRKGSCDSQWMIQENIYE